MAAENHDLNYESSSLSFSVLSTQSTNAYPSVVIRTVEKMHALGS